jgi:hypothetical protein
MNASPSQSLQAVESRRSLSPDKTDEKSRGASQPFYIPSDLDEGVLILGVQTPSIYYQKWYAFLMLDQLIQQTLPSKPKTVFVPKLDSYFYRMEVSVPLGKTAEMMQRRCTRTWSNSNTFALRINNWMQHDGRPFNTWKANRFAFGS